MDMWEIPFLICFPLVVSVLMFCIRINKIRNAVAYVSAVIIMLMTGVLTVHWGMNGFAPAEFYVETELVDHFILGAEILLMLVVTFLSFKYNRPWVSLLSIVPTAVIAWLELEGPELDAISHIKVDHLSILMCIIIGIIGSLIVIYAVGYMHGYQHYHTEIPDRRYYFFMILFIFLGAMFGFVLSDSLLWIDLFWETTSVCSFLLIGYTQQEEAIHNSFRALWMNLLGGCALCVGIVYFALDQGTASLSVLVEQGTGQAPASVQVAIALIAFAALTKAAQLPFSKWLLGAMVAPTPSSALLHSATMVKAGIYVLFRLAPAMSGNMTGTMISFIGGFTFLSASIMAIAQSDGKKVLAMSTISNLGLMVACAGVGRPETIWAGCFLMIFHAVSKSLLFQDIGATENSLHSRDVEEMHGLLYRLPVLALFMFIGICGMFLAPFGMLISKWAALKASVDENNIILVFFICFGSATTSFYWTKWLGKLIAHTNRPPVRDITKKNEMISLSIHAVLMLALCILFPFLSSVYVEPLLMEMFSESNQVISNNVLYILIILICFFFAVPFLAYIYEKNVKTNKKLSYMNGINTGKNDAFMGSMGAEKELVLANLYFKDICGQRKLMNPSIAITTAVIIIMMCMIIASALGGGMI
ncbi:NADH-quinone oxidoreductase subunit 5 family protein [Butyrivibrio sp. MC2013]|uniref:NADH-quinone oxidoreductase subunit 5 family protein n=1 Tax=Butyrivibrio sp. MC2013 TaxID=1280686 RepID=UPI0003FDBF4F|nr:proton-conducting transporter membrane subunit [Butyrivibrio sp. MC2013]